MIDTLMVIWNLAWCSRRSKVFVLGALALITCSLILFIGYPAFSRQSSLSTKAHGPGVVLRRGQTTHRRVVPGSTVVVLTTPTSASYTVYPSVPLPAPPTPTLVSITSGNNSLTPAIGTEKTRSAPTSVLPLAPTMTVTPAPGSVTVTPVVSPTVVAVLPGTPSPQPTVTPVASSTPTQSGGINDTNAGVTPTPVANSTPEATTTPMATIIVSPVPTAIPASQRARVKPMLTPQVAMSEFYLDNGLSLATRNNEHLLSLPAFWMVMSIGVAATLLFYCTIFFLHRRIYRQ